MEKIELDYPARHVVPRRVHVGVVGWSLRRISARMCW